LVFPFVHPWELNRIRCSFSSTSVLDCTNPPLKQIGSRELLIETNNGILENPLSHTISGEHTAGVTTNEPP
jgi:hypothetical protein